MPMACSESPISCGKRPGGYVPGDIKSGRGEEGGGDESDGKPKAHYAVQLALYIDILERLKCSAGRRAFVWDIHGDEVAYDFTTLEGDVLWDDYQTALAEARSILARHITPLPAYSSVCKLCHWHTHCVAQLTAADDLTLIPYLGRKERDVMQDSLPTIAALGESNPDGFIQGRKTVFRGIGPDRLRLFQARAAMLKASPPRPYLRAPVSLDLSPLELFFDVEVDPLRDVCYLHGFVERHQRDNATERFVAFFAEEPTPAAERDAFAAALDYLAARDRRGHLLLLEVRAHHLSQAPSSDTRIFARRKMSSDCLNRRARLTFTGMSSCKRRNGRHVITRSRRSPSISASLGATTHPSGAASIEWFDRWCRERTPEIRQRILDYNEDDCRATRVLLDGIRSLAA